ncbi:MAG: hypothetical protein COA78_36160 [Blastopirellula sp.]|nr:MAG: hypothetical protein COA78_36160 [Blastopirellula sp.]
MSFPHKVKEEVLVKSRRCCCVCRKFYGLYIEVHHITPKSEGGENDLDNAIPLCQDCHGQAGHYNPNHSIGNKYRPTELKKHRDSWYEWCSDNPNDPLPNHPVLISPSAVSLSYEPPVQGPISVPFQLDVKNNTEQNFYSVWVILDLSAVELNNLVLSFVDSHEIGNLGPQYIQNTTGRVCLRMVSKGSGLPNFDLSKTAVFLRSIGDPSVGYLGISNLAAKEKRTFNIEVRNITESQSEQFLLRNGSFDEKPCTWLMEQDKKFVLDFHLPEGISYEQGLEELSLIDIKYKKRD